MPTLTEVAKRAGVSIATVSKVLSNTPYFSEETRRKVLQAVDELGYIPNLAARALASGKTNIIAVVFPYVYDAIFTDPLVQHILQGIEAECSQHGYNLLLSTPRLSATGPDENYLRLIRSGYMDGVVALDNVPTTSVLESVLKKHIPAVAIGYGSHHYFARSDDWLGSTTLMEHIIALGHRHIGIITVTESLHYSVQQRMAGFKAVAQNHNIDFDALPKCEGDFSIQDGSDCTEYLLTKYPELTAIVCINDRMALGAIQQAHMQGLRVPGDLTVVGYDDIPSARLSAPPLTTVNQHAPELGRAAIQMLFEILKGNQPEAKVIPTDLMIRQSSAPPRKESASIAES